MLTNAVISTNMNNSLEKFLEITVTMDPNRSKLQEIVVG